MTTWQTHRQYVRVLCMGVAVLLGLGGVGVIGSLTAVRAATVTANVFTDPTPGDCATSGVGNCSLREAVLFANSTPGTTIQLLAGTYTLTRVNSIPPVGTMESPASSGGALSLTAPMTIAGAGASLTTIDASGMTPNQQRDGVFANASTGSTIRGVTITGGYNNSNVVNTGSLTVSDSQIVNNGGSSTGTSIGGVSNSGTLAITNTTISGNTGVVGGISNAGTMTLTVSTVQNNTASSAVSDAIGGIANSGGMTITNSTISGNMAGAPNGSGVAGIENTGTLTIIGSAVSGNTISTEVYGSSYTGGISNQGGASATITNSTISGNGAAFSRSGNDVGGINNAAPPGGGQPTRLTLNYVTLANNSGYTTNGLANSDTATLVGTLLANAGTNCSGSVTSGDYNLSSDASCTAFTQPHDKTNADPKLGPLANNGGPTQTQALQAGSAAFNAGGTSANGCPATDQRGVSRPQGTACDIGAFELQVAPTPMAHPTAPTTGGAQPSVPAPIAAAHQPVATVTAIPTTTPVPKPIPQPARH